MSIDVSLEQLAEEIERFGPTAYVLTVSGEGRPHAVAVEVRLADGRLVATVGNSTAANAGERPGISVLWPPFEAGGFSLIVDGEAEVDAPDPDGGKAIAVEPTRAVLHRPAPNGSAKAADCVPLVSRSPSG